MKKIKVENVVVTSLPEDGQSGDYYTPEYAVNDFSVYPPLGVLYVATSLKGFYPVQAFDPVAKKMGIPQTIEALVAMKPTILGISCQTYRIYPCAEIAKQVKARLPDTIIVIGGPHTTAYPVETFELPGVDYVVVGDGDTSLKLLTDALAAGDESMLSQVPGLIYKKDEKMVRNPLANNADLDSIPIPDRDLLDIKDYYTAADGDSEIITMISSRGCPFKCVYCDVLEKQYRFRSPKSVADEMEHIAKKYNDPVIHIFDDTYNLTKKRVVEISKEIIRRGIKVKWTTRARVSPFDDEMVSVMAQSGLKRAHFGVESGSPLSLQKILKGVRVEHIEKAFELCRKYGVESLAYFIIGFDWETKKEIKETIQFIGKISPDFIMANMLHPLAKTTVYEDLIKRGVYEKDYWLDQVKNPVPRFRLPPHRNAKTRKYLRRVLDEVYISFYLNPRFVLNNIANKKSGKKSQGMFMFFKELGFKIKLAFTMLFSWVKNYTIEVLDRGHNEFYPKSGGGADPGAGQPPAGANRSQPPASKDAVEAA